MAHAVEYTWRLFSKVQTLRSKKGRSGKRTEFSALQIGGIDWRSAAIRGNLPIPETEKSASHAGRYGAKFRDGDAAFSQSIRCSDITPSPCCRYRSTPRLPLGSPPVGVAARCVARTTRLSRRCGRRRTGPLPSALTIIAAPNPAHASRDNEKTNQGGTWRNSDRIQENPQQTRNPPRGLP